MLWSVDDETVEAQQTPVVYSGVKHAEAWPSLNSRVLSFIQHIWPLQPSHSYHVSLNQAVQWQKLPPLLEELVDRPCAEKMKSTVYTRTSSSLSCPSFLLAHFFCLSLLFYALFHSQILQATYPPQLKTGKMAAVLGWSVVAQSLGGSSRAKGWAEGWWLRYVRRTTRCLEQRIMNLCFDFCWNANRWLRVTRRNMG